MKTANILIARGHVLKVGDFGIAQVLSTRKIDASTVIGTPFSFSPELVCTLYSILYTFYSTCNESLVLTFPLPVPVQGSKVHK